MNQYVYIINSPLHHHNIYPTLSNPHCWRCWTHDGHSRAVNQSVPPLPPLRPTILENLKPTIGDPIMIHAPIFFSVRISPLCRPMEEGEADPEGLQRADGVAEVQRVALPARLAELEDPCSRLR